MKDFDLSETPIFGLYGEPLGNSPFFIHVEAIYTRSNIYNWEIQTHLHKNLHQVVWLESGTLTAKVSGMDLDVEGPATVILPALSTHSFITNMSSNGYVLTVNREFFSFPESQTLSEVFSDLFSVPSLIDLKDAGKEVDKVSLLISFIKDEIDGGTGKEWFVCYKLMQIVFLLFVRYIGNRKVCPEEKMIKDKKVSDFLLMVDSYFSSDMKLMDYADRLNLSIDRLILISHFHLNKSPMQVVIDRRLKEACQLLIQTKLPIVEISQMTGFSDPSYFSRFFKQRTGMTPLSFRRQGSPNPLSKRI